MEIISCPICKGILVHEEENFVCKSCLKHFPIKNNIGILVPNPSEHLQFIQQKIEEKENWYRGDQIHSYDKGPYRFHLRKRIEFVKNQSYPIKPKVLAIEWIWPFFTSGHWVPQMIQFAGGQNQISKTGEHSRRLEFEEIKNSDPDIIVMMPCGFDTQRTVSEYDKFLKNNSSWNSLRAVKNKKVYAVDANAYFSKPSIRTITGLEILAKIFHPEKFEQLHVPENSFLSITN